MVLINGNMLTCRIAQIIDCIEKVSSAAARCTVHYDTETALSICHFYIF